MILDMHGKITPNNVIGLSETSIMAVVLDIYGTLLEYV